MMPWRKDAALQKRFARDAGLVGLLGAAPRVGRPPAILSVPNDFTLRLMWGSMFRKAVGRFVSVFLLAARKLSDVSVANLIVPQFCHGLAAQYDNDKEGEITMMISKMHCAFGAVALLTGEMRLSLFFAQGNGRGAEATQPIRGRL